MTNTQNIWDPDLHIPGKSVITRGVSVFLFGGIGTIKTTWAGSWPSPIFLSVGYEGGDDSLAMLPQVLGIETPPVYHIDSTKKMRDKVNYICLNHKKYGWKTVVIDSVTFYTDVYIREVIEVYQRKNLAPQMQKRDWAFLEAHICKELAQRLHGTNLNVIWIALSKDKWSSASPQGERHLEGVVPMMQGAAATKLPAMCKMVIYADKELVPAPTGMISRPVFYTAPTLLTKDVRHKYGNAFPEGQLVDPQHGTWPTFRALDERIGQFVYK